MKSVAIYKCRICCYKLIEFDGQIPMNFMLICPKCHVRLKKKKCV